MKELFGEKIIISGLISSKIDLNEFLIPIRKIINDNGDEIIEEFVQRRGVSRSNKPGGSKSLNLPLSNRTYISIGKAN